MLLRGITILLVGSALLFARSAWAEGYAFPINLPDGTLATSLQGLARQSGAELLFDANLLRGQRASGVRGRLSVDAALVRLLAGTDLAPRRAASGAWLIERRGGPDAPAPQDLAVPEILVVGRRTQDADIRRRENDIQPYQVATREQLVRAHRDNLDQFFRSRVTANTVIRPPSLLTNGETRSEIDLRGLGANQTLILVDGRRLPGIPGIQLDFDQPDINAIPLHAIERVETLTGTAGGIYGFGALGGVVNVVLRRDYHGPELHGTSGINTRGGARRIALEGGVGFTPDGGRTDVMLYASHSREEPLRLGDSKTTLRGRGMAVRRQNDQFVFLPPASNTFFIANLFSTDPLVLKPGYGGGSLGSSYTYLPRGFMGTGAKLTAALLQHAGQIDYGPADEEKASYLTSNPRTTSLILNVRHRFGGGVEGYFDGLYLRNQGRYVNHQPSVASRLVLSPDAPVNPFDNYVEVTFPGPYSTQYIDDRVTTERYTAGLIVPLPLSWRATMEATFGAVHHDTDSGSTGFYIGPFIADGSESPVLDPFANGPAFERSIAQYSSGPLARTVREHSRFREQSLRIAGPVFRTAAGPATLSVLVQNRSENVPAFTSTSFVFEPPISISTSGKRINETRSAYAEIDAPLIAPTARIPLLKGLTIQLALRHDRQRVSFPLDADVDGPQRPLHARFAGTAYTAGVKFNPLPWMMLRASYATGKQPPPLQDLTGYEIRFDRFLLTDPKRDYSFEDGDYLERGGGSPDLRTIRASTVAAGVVLNPNGDGAPRFSIDYSRNRRIGDISTLTTDVVLAHEDQFPGRVIRGPLTDADRALGYTAGPVDEVDIRSVNGGRLTVESIDAQIDWRVPLAGGTLRAYGRVTRQMVNRKTDLFVAPVDRVGFFDGPLKWRANGGAEWTIGRSMIGANLQYFGRYRIASSVQLDAADIEAVKQGSAYVKAQTYLDLYASRRFPVQWGGAVHEFSIDFAIVNLLDRMPSFEADRNSIGTPQYSLYGDPRQRRFELTLNLSF